MSMTDPLGDMLTRIRNGQRAHKPIVAAPGVAGSAPTCSRC